MIAPCNMLARRLELNTQPQQLIDAGFQDSVPTHSGACPRAGRQV